MFFKKTGTHDMKRWLHFLWFIFTTTLLADRYEAVVDAGAAEVAHEIGTAHVQGDLGPVTHKAAHAALGAASSALTGQDPAAGAIGAAVAETVAEVAHVPGKNPITTSNLSPLPSRPASSVPPSPYSPPVIPFRPTMLPKMQSTEISLSICMKLIHIEL